MFIISFSTCPANSGLPAAEVIPSINLGFTWPMSPNLLVISCSGTEPPFEAVSTKSFFANGAIPGNPPSKYLRKRDDPTPAKPAMAGPLTISLASFKFWGGFSTAVFTLGEVYPSKSIRVLLTTSPPPYPAAAPPPISGAAASPSVGAESIAPPPAPKTAPAAGIMGFSNHQGGVLLGF